MNKDEILAKARKENKYQDVSADALKMESRKVTRMILFAVAVILAVLQFISGHTEDFTLVRIMVWAVDFGESLFVAIKRNEKKDWTEAVLMLGLLLMDGTAYVKHLFG